MDHESQVALPAWLNSEAIGEFIDELRLADYKIGVDQHIAVQKLLLALIARGVQLDQPSQLANYLGPVICTSQTEQQDFHARFARWVERMEMGQGKPELAAEHIDHLVVELQTIERQWFWFRWGMVVIILLMAALLPASAIPEYKRPEPVVLIQPTIEGSVTSTKTPVPIPTQQNAPRARLHWNLWRVFGLVALTFLLVFVAWRWWWFRRAALFLERQATKTEPVIEQVSVQGLHDQLFSDTSMSSVAQAFRRRVEKLSHMLDIERTLTKSLAQSGWFTPVFDRRQIKPEYLFLVDRTNHQDQQAKLAETLIQGLQENDVLTVVYYFDGDPRLCFADTTAAHAWLLPELVNKYESHRLLLFTDGTHFFDALNGEFEPWTEYLQRWTDRAILTPVIPSQWRHREEALTERFILLPATADGLAQFIQIRDNEAPILDPLQEFKSPYPTELEARPFIWLQRDPPETKLVDDMIVELRRYLGTDSFNWLSACAAYPALTWNLTLYLGATLRGTDGKQLLEQHRLAALLRLPWFRHGYMPDWLRIRLLTGLTSDEDDRIRKALEDLLITAVLSETGKFQLEIAHKHHRTIERLAKPLLAILIQNASNDSPLRDYIFLISIAGRWQSQLALHVSNTLRNILNSVPISSRLTQHLTAKANYLTSELAIWPRLQVLVGIIIIAMVSIILPVFLYPYFSSWITRGPLILIPAGTAVIGTNDPAAGAVEQPQILVQLGSYDIERYEVTNIQYRRCVNVRRCTPPMNSRRVEDKRYNEHPVVGVTAIQAASYCQWVGRRLPTELEWEHAARGNSGSAWPWGNEPPTVARVNMPLLGVEPLESVPVTAMATGASPEGVFQLIGNAWEWTSSPDQLYQDYDTALFWDGEVASLKKDEFLVMRGGGHDRAIERVTKRSTFPADQSSDSLGFRCVQDS